MPFEELEKINTTEFHINYKTPEKKFDISFFEVDFKENKPDIIDMMLYECNIFEIDLISVKVSYFCVFHEFCYQVIEKNMISDSQIAQKWRFCWN